MRIRSFFSNKATASHLITHCFPLYECVWHKDISLIKMLIYVFYIFIQYYYIILVTEGAFGKALGREQIFTKF